MVRVETLSRALLSSAVSGGFTGDRQGAIVFILERVGSLEWSLGSFSIAWVQMVGIAWVHSDAHRVHSRSRSLFTRAVVLMSRTVSSNFLKQNAAHVTLKSLDRISCLPRNCARCENIVDKQTDSRQTDRQTDRQVL